MYALTSILAGPVVRRVEPEGASVWLALPRSAEVELRVFNTKGELVCTGSSPSAQIGSGLHLVLLRALCKEPGRKLVWGEEYQYEIEIDGEVLEVSELLYPTGPERLSFCLPGATLESTRLIHGSCRHPSEPGFDALSILDDLLEDSFSGAEARPQLFVCSGDLIYADSPSEALLKLVGEVGDRLLGYREELPGIPYCASEIPLDERHKIAGEVAKIYDPPKRQLFGLGEFLAMHLLVLSPTLWPEDVSDELSTFHASLPKVRRALANTAFYAIFDDHEVTDDWNLTRAWSERVLGSPLGRTMVCNGMAAFALMHVWGNEPKHFEANGPGHRIVELLTGKRADNSELSLVLGVPDTVGETLTPLKTALPWHFRLQTPAIDLRGLDTRSVRHFPSDDPHGIPDQLSAQAIKEQLSDWQGLPVIVTAAPLAPPPWTRTLLFVRRLLDRRSSDERHISDVYIPDRGDEWVPKSDVFQSVLENLPGAWVSLGGDTHISYAASLEQKSGKSAIFVSSGMKRQNRERNWRQRIGYSFPWPFIPSRPVVKTELFTMRYLRTAKGSNGKVYEYFAQNNIGALHFEVAEEQITAIHTAWSRANSQTRVSVPTRVALRSK